MDRADLIGELAKRCNLKLIDAARAVVSLFDPQTGVIAEALAAEDAVKIDTFGTFKLVEHKGRTWRDPQGRSVRRGARRVVRLKASRELTRHLNRERTLETTEEG